MNSAIDAIKPKLVLHCGANKTGTTAIQLACRENRELLRRNGILYPDLEVEGVTARSHFPMAIAFLKTPETYYIMKDKGFDHARAISYAAHVREAFLAQVAQSQCDTVLVSSEAFSLIAPDEIAAAHQFFKAHFREVVAIYYARSPVDGLLSFMQQDLKGGNLTDIERLSNRKVMKFGVVAARLKEEFGDILSLRLFERDALYKQDILSDLFHQTMGLHTLPEGLKSASTNESLSAQAAAMLHFSNRVVPRRQDGKINPLFSEIFVTAARYTRRYKDDPRLLLPHDRWAAFVRQSLASDFMRFLELAGLQDRIQEFKAQLAADKRSYPDLGPPRKQEVDDWMRENLRGFRYNLVPPNVASALRAGLARDPV